MWKHFVDAGQLHGVTSGKQLAFLLGKLRRENIRTLIDNQLASGYSKHADHAVERVLSFCRNWAGFAVPRYLGTLDRIQRHVLQRHQLPHGDYLSFCTETENLYRGHFIAALDEYGLPPHLAQRLERHVRAETLDDLLEEFKTTSSTREIASHPFEVALMDYARDGL